MDHQERERERGRTSRASSTSSLGREVRCACQFFQSDSLLPERRAMIISRPSSRNANQQSIANVRGTAEDATMFDLHNEHEYEPIGTPLVKPRTMTPISTAPVVRIIDTDVAPVADSDDSIDLGGRFTPGPVLEGNELILPLDGQIEDSAMETKELAGGGDTSEELESPQQLQDRLEERFLNAATPYTEYKTDGKVNTSQADSSAMQDLPLRRGARGLPQRLRFQAGKLRSRLKSMQRPNFTLSIDRLKSEKTASPSSKPRGSSDKRSSGGSRSEKTKSSWTEEAKPSSRAADKRSRIERIRSSLPDRARLSLPNRPKFHFPERSKFHLPERPRFNIKKPNVHFPTLGKSRRIPPSLSDQQQQQQQQQVQRKRSDESSAGSRRNIFDFSTYPRLFDKKSKIQGEYATSSPKESRAQSTESSTLPRGRKTVAAPLGPPWSQKFTDIKFADDEEDELGKTLAERSKPWRRPSFEQPRVSLGPQESIEEPMESLLPWEDSHEKGGGVERNQRIERVTYEEEEQEGEGEEEINQGRGLKLTRHTSEEFYEEERLRIDPQLYGDQEIRRDEASIEEDNSIEMDREAYRAAFMAVDPRYYKQGDGRDKSNEIKSERGEQPEDEENEPLSSGMDEDISARSDREQQQSSGSSFERRRYGVIEDVNSDKCIIRKQEISQEDANIPRYLTSEICKALETPDNALAHEILIVASKPPQRPARMRSLRKRKETSVESYKIIGPVRPKRDIRRRSVEANYDYEVESIPDNGDDSFGSESRHRVVYHAESTCLDLARMEPLDEPLVIVKPIRRKSRSSFGESQSLGRPESLVAQLERPTQEIAMVPSAPPRRRKRVDGAPMVSTDEVRAPRVNGVGACNGHHFPRVSIEPDIEAEIMKTPAPKKPERATSRETLPPPPQSSAASMKRIDDEQPPVPPKRSSRSRGTSLAPDDDRTSHGAESLPEIGYTEDDIPQDTEDACLEYPGYATIEKREKPPRPPPPRKRREEKFATTPRVGKFPNRPQRAYSTLRPATLTTPSEVMLQSDVDATTTTTTTTTTYEQVDSEGEADEDEDEDEREGHVLSGMVVSMIQGRPLPAPPRPPRCRRDKNVQEAEAETEAALEENPLMSEAFASTQTDPLPDDMIIEEEVTRAKLIVSPSRSGSQILVSTERIPSPAMTNFSVDCTRSFSQGAPASNYDNEISDLDEQERGKYSKSFELMSEPPEKKSYQTFERQRQRQRRRRSRTTPSPVRGATAPIVPPLPTEKSWSYRDDLPENFTPSPEREHESRSTSPVLLREIARKRNDYEADIETRLQSSLSERIRLEEELERARNLRSALLASEPMKIASLEVTDLRVENLNVTNLEAQKLMASDIDALVVSASEISKKGETTMADESASLQPTLLRELMAIRSQLELVNSSSQEAITTTTAACRSAIERIERERKRGWEEEEEQERWRPQQQVTKPRESSLVCSNIEQPSATAHLQHDRVSRTTETRAIFSSVGTSRESSPPQRSIPSCVLPATTVTPNKQELVGKEEARSGSRSRSRSSSPGRAGSPTRLRQTASPVKSLPPVISVTPDTPDPIQNTVEASSEMTMPQRAVLSYVQEESSPPSITSGNTRFVAFTTSSQIPAEFFTLASPSVPATTTRSVQEPGVLDLGQQLVQALRIAIKRAMRHFVGYIVNRIGHEDTDTKMREVEIALCALLLIIVGLLIVCFSGPRTITHHHHWDYFNPPRL